MSTGDIAHGIVTLTPGELTLTADLYHAQDSAMRSDGTVEIRCDGGGLCVVRPNGHRVIDVRMLAPRYSGSGSG